MWYDFWIDKRCKVRQKTGRIYGNLIYVEGEKEEKKR